MIDAVGMESHGFSPDNLLLRAKQNFGIGVNRACALYGADGLSQGGRVSIPSVYGGIADHFPLGALMEKGLEVPTLHSHVQRYTKPLLNRIKAGKIDTTFLISHRLSLESAPAGYRTFHDNQNEWTKVVLRP